MSEFVIPIYIVGSVNRFTQTNHWNYQFVVAVYKSYDKGFGVTNSEQQGALWLRRLEIATAPALPALLRPRNDGERQVPFSNEGIQNINPVIARLEGLVR